MRLRRRIFLTTLALLLLLCAAGGWLVATEAGMRWALARATAALDGRLAIGAAQGRLIGPLELSEVAWRDDGLVVAISRAQLVWRPVALLAGRLELAQLAVGSVDVQLPESPAQPPAPGPSQGPAGLPRLPLAIGLDDATVDRLTVTPHGGEPFTVSNFQAAARLGPGGLDLSRFGAELLQGRVTAQGRVGAGHDAPLDLGLEWQLVPPGWQLASSGRARLGGRLDRPELRVESTGAVRGQFEAGIDTRTRPGRWQLQGRIEPVALQTLAADLPAVTVGGEVQGGGEFERFRLEGAVTAEERQAGPWRATFSGGREGALWRLDDLRLASTAAPAAVTGSASWDQGSGRLDADLDWHDLAWPPVGTPRAVSRAGRLGAHGPRAAIALQGEGEWQVGTAPVGHFELEGSVGGSELALRRLAADWLEGKWLADGRLDWGGPVPRWSAHASLAGVDPGRLAAEWPGRVDAEVSARGELSEAVAVELALQRLGGRLRGQPLGGQGELRLAGSDLTIRQLELRSGEARLSADGTLAESLALALELKVPRLGELLPGGKGSLAADARLTGTRARPHLAAKLAADNLAFAGRSVGQVSLVADLSGSAGERWSLNGKARDLDLGPAGRLATLDLTGNGGAESHTLRLEGQGPEQALLLAAEGGLEGGSWRGHLTQGRLRLPGAGSWEQARAAPLAVGADRSELRDWCWRSGPAEACLGANSAGGGGEAQLRLARLPLSLLAAARPELRARGELNGGARVGWGAGRLTALTADLVSEQGALVMPGPEDEALTAAFRRIAFSARQENQELIAGFQLVLESGGQAKAELRLGDWQREPLAERPLRGELSLDVGQLAWLAPLTSRIAEPRGRIAGRFTLGGRLRAPAIQGELKLSEAGVVVPDAGITLSGLELTAASVPDGSLRLAGRATSGPGTLHLDGRIVPPGAADWRVDLSVKGERFLAAKLPPAQAYVSPDLQIAVTAAAIDVKGKVTIPEAKIRLPEIPHTAQGSPDLVVVDRPAPEPGGPQKLNAEVRVVLGDKVQVEGYGFTGRITGAITAIEAPGAVPRGHGELQVVDGRYEAYGQKLAVSEGRLLFAGGPLGEPGLAFKAVRKLEEEKVTVGVEVTGSARRPKMRLFSEPGMEESDILSYLLLGRPLRNASKQEAGGLTQAALALAGGERVARQIAGQFGIDTVEMGGGTKPGDTAVALGKYLSPRLYVQYLVGITEAANAWRLRYKWTEHWSLEAQTGQKGGADLMFTIER